MLKVISRYLCIDLIREVLLQNIMIFRSSLALGLDICERMIGHLTYNNHVIILN